MSASADGISEASLRRVGQLLQPLVNRALAELRQGIELLDDEAFAPILLADSNKYFLVLSTSFNCEIGRRPDRPGFGLAVNVGLVHFLERAAGLILSGVTVVGESEFDEGPPDVDPFPSETQVERTRTLCEHFWNGTLPQDDSGALADRDAVNRAFSDVVLLGAIKFAIAHEYGHILLDSNLHLDRVRDRAREDAAGFLASIELQPDTRRRRLEDWTTELAADRLGCELALKAWPDDELPVQFGWLGVELFFIICEMLWRYHLATRDRSIDVLGTHPPFHVRRLILRRSLSPPYHHHDIGPALRRQMEALLEAVCGSVPEVNALGRVDVAAQATVRSVEDARFGLKDGSDPELVRDRLERALASFEESEDIAGWAEVQALLAQLHARNDDTRSAAVAQARSLGAAMLARGQVQTDPIGQKLTEIVNGAPEPEREALAGAVFQALQATLAKWGGDPTPDEVG